MSLVAGVGAKTQCPRETAYVGPGRRYARRQLAPDGGGEAC
jgi:hypothetical protein